VSHAAEKISGVVLKIKVSSVAEALRSSALGMRIEVPKGVGCGEGVPLSPLKMVGFVTF